MTISVADANLPLNAVAVEGRKHFGSRASIAIANRRNQAAWKTGWLQQHPSATVGWILMLVYDAIDALPHHKALSYPSSSVMVSLLLPPRSLP